MCVESRGVGTCGVSRRCGGRRTHVGMEGTMESRMDEFRMVK